MTPVPEMRLFEVAPDDRVFPQRYTDQGRPAGYFPATATGHGELVVGAVLIGVGLRFCEKAAGGKKDLVRREADVAAGESGFPSRAANGNSISPTICTRSRPLMKMETSSTIPSTGTSLLPIVKWIPFILEFYAGYSYWTASTMSLRAAERAGRSPARVPMRRPERRAARAGSLG